MRTFFEKMWLLLLIAVTLTLYAEAGSLEALDVSESWGWWIAAAGWLVAGNDYGDS